MPAFCVFDVREIRDTEKMDQYRAKVDETIEAYGGKYVVLGGECQVVEGDYKPIFPVILEFPSLAEARRWYDSEEYQDILPLRLQSSSANAFFVAGR